MVPMTDLELAHLETTCGQVAAALQMPREPGEDLYAWRDRLIASGEVVDIRDRVVVLAGTPNYISVDFTIAVDP